jgi:hypothetical protein
VPCFTNQVSIANYVVTKAGEAAASQTAAGSSATAAAAAYDSFDDRYLGAKSSNPTVDNDGNALLTGALYWNTVSNEMRVYSGSAWIAAYIPSSGYLALSGGTMTGAITFAAGQFGTNVNTFLSTPSSANLAAALTDETGSGAAVFADTPTLIAPILGTPTSGTLTNCTFPTLNQNTTGTAATATNLASGSAGTIPYQTASGTTAMLAAGTSGQVLTSAGAAAPTWSTPAAATKTISNKTGTFTVVAGDLGKIINCTSGTFTVSLTAAASLGSGFTCTIWNTSNTATDAITINPNASETIDGMATLVLRRGEGLAIVCNGTNWETDDKKPMRGYAENIASDADRPVATGDGATALGYQTTASSIRAIAIGANSNGSGSVATTGAGAMALGGSYASGTDSFAAAIANNTSSYGATGANSVAIGRQAKVTGTNSLSLGYLSVASGATSTVLGGLQSQATGDYSVALGNNALSAQYGKYSYASGYLGAGGDAQSGKIVLRGASTASVAILTSDGSGTASSTNQLALAANQAMVVKGMLIGKQVGGGNGIAAYEISASAVYVGGTLTLGAGVLTLIGSNTLPGTFTAPTITADTTNGAIKITSGKSSSTNVYWVCLLQSAEVTGS